jgi:ATP-dependent Lhr-like helicase
MTPPDALEGFHPAVAAWFCASFPDGPTEVQARAWASIAEGRDTLLSAPTGSGKTLAAFLVAIDRCLSRDEGEPETSVLYVSPLRALTVDVREHLEAPLAAIGELARRSGRALRDVRIAVRNGDTPAAQRAAIVRRPPDILVTTPESLYLLLGSAGGRRVLATVETVIVDEIHALAGDRRGAHLSLSLARLDRLVRASGRRERVRRVGCSATQRPLELTARLLAGSHPPAPCTVVDLGHERPARLEIELPASELGAAMTTEQFGEVVGQVAEKVRSARSTLVFVSTRRLAERLARLLAERLEPELGPGAVRAHHASLSPTRRLAVEEALRRGELRAVVATASLELGIDVGPVDHVCQIGSPRAIGTLLQRVGRANHRVGGMAHATLHPLTRDDLVECTALLAAVRAGELDELPPLRGPLDVLAQHLVAECAASPSGALEEDEAYALARAAAPYEDLPRDTFLEVVRLVSDGVRTGRGRRGAHLHRDAVQRVLRPRRGARLAALTGGGTIPDTAEYQVRVLPDGAVVGSVDEDWAVESMAGDVFLLGSSTWRVRRVEGTTVWVDDAPGASPTLPFWLGEAPGRSAELSRAVARLREEVESCLTTAGRAAAAARVRELAGTGERVADEVVAYLDTARAQLGEIPTQRRLVVERFFDETGGTQIVLHAPFGARLNRALGLLVRKRFCRSFDFELQAAASDDAVLLSLGPQHAFPLHEIGDLLSPQGAEDALVQSLLPLPMLRARWRWNLVRALVLARVRDGRRLPIARMEADDLMAAVFPGLVACQENVTGPLTVPDHPLVRQTLEDCRVEATDAEGMLRLLGAIRAGEVLVRYVDTAEPSVLAHEILSGRPFTFLDPAPLEERRSRALFLRRGLPAEPLSPSALREEVLARLQTLVASAPRDEEELHDLLVRRVLVQERPEWSPWLAGLAAARRAARVRAAGLARGWWCAAERVGAVRRLLGSAVLDPELPGLEDEEVPDAEDVLVEMVRGHLEALVGPTAAELSETLALDGWAGPRASLRLSAALARLVAEGFVLPVDVARGHDATLAEASSSRRYFARDHVARAHALARAARPRPEPAVPPGAFFDFLLRWQHVAAEERLFGTAGLRAVVAQLQGHEAPAVAWEAGLLPARVLGYQAALLDECCATGEIGWGRLAPPPPAEGPAASRGRATPSRSTPLALFCRADLPWLLAACRGAHTASPAAPPGVLGEVVAALEEEGALFLADLCDLTGRLPVEVADALWEGVARGLVTADSYQAVRRLLAGTDRRLRIASPARRPGLGQVLGDGRGAGRFALLRPARLRARPGESTPAAEDLDLLAERVARQLLERWGVVWYELVQREPLTAATPWRLVLQALRRLDARGEALSGRYVAGVASEQFALPEAAAALRHGGAHAPGAPTGARRRLRLLAADPLNLTGLLLPGPRVPATWPRQVEVDVPLSPLGAKGGHLSSR